MNESISTMLIAAFSREIEEQELDYNTNLMSNCILVLI